MKHSTQLVKEKATKISSHVPDISHHKQGKVCVYSLNERRNRVGKI